MNSKLIRNYIPEFFALNFVRSGPRVVSINLTGKCNQKCVYCEIGQGHASPLKTELTTDDLKWILDEMATNKIRRIAINGGEPFLFRNLIEIVAYAAKKISIVRLLAMG